MATLLRAWAHNESNRPSFVAYTGPNHYLIDLLLDAANEMDAALAVPEEVTIRERLEITNEHIGRLVHAFDGDRKELLRKIYAQNVSALSPQVTKEKP